MLKKDFDSLSSDLQRISPKIPLKWGHIQNDLYDNELKKYCNIFSVTSLDVLEFYISHFDDEHKNYYRRRWYLLRCADCDEYLFYRNPGVEHNPDRRDKKWDIRINHSHIFDVKGTVIPRSFINAYDNVVQNPSEMIRFYYDKQSRGTRFDIQDRLFIVHHSLVDPAREFFLRCAWGIKESVYTRFVNEIDRIHFCEYKNCVAGVIFLVEIQKGLIEYKISGLDESLQRINTTDYGR